ncbi:uncharacterized protein LOC127811550 isoform X2 [Diospyros lotus]|uniref:uncharacterized protein LOC127811550 isoform X2 n=1 Tax=Diospyros lotus TaxID=55363 RepID=UPI0022531836|nr:uncharacterized protein LOC127811550 isoform X2 [Diospyros lotus]
MSLENEEIRTREGGEGGSSSDSGNLSIIASSHRHTNCHQVPELDALWRGEARSSSDSGNLNSTLSLESRKEEQGKEREIERGEARSSSDSLATFLKRRHRGKMGKEKCEEKLEDEDDVERESNQRMKMSGMKRTMRRKKSRVLRSPFAELLDKTMTKRSHKGNNVRFPNKE